MSKELSGKFPPFIPDNLKGCQSLLKRAYQELEQYRWIPVSERLPDVDNEFNRFQTILILDDRDVRVGYYEDNKFVWWHGSFCNKDEPGSQKAITYWRPIILPE